MWVQQINLTNLTNTFFIVGDERFSSPRRRVICGSQIQGILLSVLWIKFSHHLISKKTKSISTSHEMHHIPTPWSINTGQDLVLLLIFTITVGGIWDPSCVFWPWHMSSNMTEWNSMYARLHYELPSPFTVIMFHSGLTVRASSLCFDRLCMKNI